MMGAGLMPFIGDGPPGTGDNDFVEGIGELEGLDFIWLLCSCWFIFIPEI
jgi:hypothetical protein